MRKHWEDRAWDDYIYWQSQDKKTIKRINALLRDIDRSPFEGIGDPELMKWGRFSGYWSRNIDEVNRLVYRIVGQPGNQSIEIILCRGHYDD